MGGLLSKIVSESMHAKRKGGVGAVWKRVTEHMTYRLSDAALFSRHVPPVAVGIGEQHLRVGYRNKYIYRAGGPVVAPEAGDTVVEAGAFHGRDTATFAKLADRVIGFEPSPRNCRVAKANLHHFGNVDIYEEGLWNESAELTIKQGASAGDDGFFEPDDGGRGGEATVPVNRLDERMAELDVDRVDFLKVEAEGAEPEVLEGIGDLDIPKIVVNADEERDGDSPAREVFELLSERGYYLVGMTLGCVLFFTTDADYHYAFRPADFVSD
jgi:FkbM family methyltransferase